MFNPGWISEAAGEPVAHSHVRHVGEQAAAAAKQPEASSCQERDKPFQWG